MSFIERSKQVISEEVFRRTGLEDEQLHLRHLSDAIAAVTQLVNDPDNDIGQVINEKMTGRTGCMPPYTQELQIDETVCLLVDKQGKTAVAAYIYDRGWEHQKSIMYMLVPKGIDSREAIGSMTYHFGLTESDKIPASLIDFIFLPKVEKFEEGDPYHARFHHYFTDYIPPQPPQISEGDIK